MTGTDPQPSTSAAIRFFRAVWRRHPLRMLAVVISMSVTSVSEGVGIALLIPLLSTLGLGEGAALGRVGEAARVAFSTVGLPMTLTTVLVAFVAVVWIENALRYAQRRYARRFLTDFSVRLRTALYDAYLSASWTFRVQRHVGHMVNRLTSEGTRVEAAFYYMTFALSEAAFITVFLGLAFLISWQLATYFLLAGVVVFGLMRGRFRPSDRTGTAVGQRGNDLQELLQEHLTAGKYIKASGTAARSRQSVVGAIDSLARTELDGVIHSYLMNAVLQPVVAVVLAGGLFLALRWLRLDAAQVLVMLVVFYRMSPKIATLQQMTHGVRMSAPAFVSIDDEIRTARAAAEPDVASGAPVPSIRTGIRFDAVTFAYPGRESIIRDLSLEIVANRTTALVGGSGAGKSTLLDLLLGLLRPQQGTITVDGQSLATLDVQAWRRQVGYVAQETVLFHDSVRANIAWARPDATDSEVERAARLANAHDFIVRMPQGYDTVIGQRGSLLSGGERQRLALARALVTEPRLLVLDEATSNLDAESERSVQTAVDSLRSTMTIVVVAHRLATVRNADTIYVLDAGGVAESGRWDELLARGGRLAELWALQSDGAR
jgi:ATP-binding cassette, subfamily C, bacterial